jgi:hypothetical protein
MTGKGTTKEPYRFDDDVPGNEHEQWVVAFGVCRDRNRPIVVQVGPSVERIFPSGHFERVRFEGTPATIQ